MNKFFIEIGTSDFNTLEHLAVQGWSGIFVEPDPWYLNKLRRFTGCIYEQSAILDYNGTTTFHNFDAEWAAEHQDSEIWVHGVGTTSDMNNMNTNPDWPRVEFEVNVKTLSRLISNHGVKRIDFLKTDIEGLDTKIFYGENDFEPNDLWFFDKQVI